MCTGLTETPLEGHYGNRTIERTLTTTLETHLFSTELCVITPHTQKYSLNTNKTKTDISKHEKEVRVGGASVQCQKGSELSINATLTGMYLQLQPFT